MTMPYIFKAAATRDFDEAFDWYEQQEVGRGDLFAAEIENALRLICRNPNLHPTIYRDVRAQRVETYPYRILYRIRAAKIIIIAVHHHRNNPKIWQHRI